MADRVLVVEDDAAIARLLRLVLERAGYEVAVVANGLDAVEWAIRERPDAMVLDVTLPGIDGFEVLSRIRRHPRTLFMVVILLTGKAGPADREYGWHLEPDDFVLKPFDPQDLVARLRAHLRRTRSAISTTWTLLPGGTAIESEVRSALERRDGFALALVDLDEFKAFNDRYGFERGNRAIDMLARIVQSVANDIAAGAFAGHVGGDDFVLITPPELAVKAAEEVIERIDRGVPTLYDRDDRAAGFVNVQDRTRRVRRHRLMTVSIGITVTTAGRFRHFGEVAGAAAEMKAVAKRDPFSSYAIDRRSDEVDPPG
jgi:diguanylate cyclase (GGDEF)-like protein